MSSMQDREKAFEAKFALDAVRRDFADLNNVVENNASPRGGLGNATPPSIGDFGSLSSIASPSFGLSAKERSTVTASRLRMKEATNGYREALENSRGTRSAEVQASFRKMRDAMKAEIPRIEKVLGKYAAKYKGR